MNVLLIIEGTYPWYRGGVSEWVYQYLNHFSDYKFVILQIATDEFQGLDPNTALYPLTDNIDDFIRVSPPEMKGEWNQYLKNWKESISGILSSITGKYELIHTTNTGFAGWLGGKISQTNDLPMLLTEHAIYWKEVEMGAVALECGYKIPQTKSGLERVSNAFKDIATFTYSNAEHIVTVSEYNIPFQKKLGAKKIEYIPNGIKESWLIDSKSRGKEPVMGWVGRCANMKNPLAFFDYVKAYEKLEVAPVFKMLLSDANEKDLEAKVRKKAEEFPEVELIWNKSAKKYYSEFDFLVITSHNESQPLVMLEALANKVLPVGYQVGDVTQKYGMVFKPSVSILEIAKSIEDLWQNARHFEEYVERRFQLVKDNHTWGTIFKNYRLLMEQRIAVQTTLKR
jgi:hypothetical protein